MRSWITLLVLTLMPTVATEGRADNPASEHTKWRIPEGRASSNSIHWYKAKPSLSHVNLSGAIASHYTYEDAWEYYARLLGCKSNYIAGATRDTFDKEGFMISEIPKSNAYRINRSLPIPAGDEARSKDRHTTMMGTIDGKQVLIYLWTEVDNPVVAERVYVKMHFRPMK